MSDVQPRASDIKPGDKFSMDITKHPPWWAFWRKPITERKVFTVMAAVTGDAW